MKKVIICRHAKSSWAQLGQRDYDRGLNDRGNADAPNMGSRLKLKNLVPNVVISSTAQRAKETTWHLCNAMNYDLRDIIWYNELYHAPEHVIDEIIALTPDKFDYAMVVCHNPGITYWVNDQAGLLTENVPTCGMYCFESDADTWLDYGSSKKRLSWYDYPKNV